MKNSCPSAQFCGGCQYQGIKYEKQLESKQEKVEKLLSSFHTVEKIIPCKVPYHYRNKAQFTFAADEESHIYYGFYMSKTHMVVPVEECMICNEGMSKIMSSIKKTVILQHIPIYNERAKKGFLRHVLIRSSNKGEYMVVLVTGVDLNARKEILVKQILKYNPEVKTIVQNINGSPGSQVLGKRNIVLYGSGYITDRLCGLDFRISPASFYQVNSLQTQVLYNEAIRCAQLNEEETLIDAYCGTGTIGLTASKYVKKVFGVEINKSALKDAKVNRKINDISNAEFVLADAGRYMETLSRKKEKVDIVIMDPPRAGSDTKFMSSLVRMNPEKVVYVSCNPVTLKRDLQYLQRSYTIEKIQPIDMFPFTDHCETIVRLISRNTKSKVCQTTSQTD